jgi:hypothetical protein
MNNEQHREDTKYVQWADGMYVMLDDLLCDYERALIEDSLRRSVYFSGDMHLGGEAYMGVLLNDAGYWETPYYIEFIKLTRAQALYIATGDTDI